MWYTFTLAWRGSTENEEDPAHALGRLGQWERKQHRPRRICSCAGHAWSGGGPRKWLLNTLTLPMLCSSHAGSVARLFPVLTTCSGSASFLNNRPANWG